MEQVSKVFVFGSKNQRNTRVQGSILSSSMASRGAPSANTRRIVMKSPSGFPPAAFLLGISNAYALLCVTYVKQQKPGGYNWSIIYPVKDRKGNPTEKQNRGLLQNISVKGFG